MGTPIFVLDHQGNPLMPTRRHNKVWYWVRKGMAKVVRREPLTIQLCFETTAYRQAVTVGVDTGSKTVGIAATTNGAVVSQAEVHLRTDIAEKMIQRQQYRRTRRGRKTRYRPARWANRRRPHGWLPSSVRSKSDATVKAVRFVSSLLPVSQVNVEIAGFDTQKLQDPEIAGVSYQQGELFGYQLREYLLEKWTRQCAYCKKTGLALQIEHIVPKARGGSDRVANLTLACETCNLRKGTQTAEEFGYPEIQKQARIPLKDAAHVSSLKTAVLQQLRSRFGAASVAITYGYETKYKRIQVLGWSKSHTNDSATIACQMGEVVKPLPEMFQILCLPRGQYQRFNGLGSSHKCWAPRKVRGFKLYELVKVNGQVGYIAGRREKGAFVVKDVMSRKKGAEVTPRKLLRVARPSQGWMMTRQPSLEKIRKEGGASSSS